MSRPAGESSSRLDLRTERGRLPPTSRHWTPKRLPRLKWQRCRHPSPPSGATMELRHLRYFIAIAEERSISRAAERLWIAQPGLSTQVRRLQNELGIQLVPRAPA